ncbi:MAG: helix-turn-helix domain-containing protein [Propionibacteriaceae bacterium]|jgi:lambda repressor-like predicted transcriptional regulator|nr:helix-turn-helix domain-containing protein [Propionibacteriaceae bacterium]
MTNFSPYHSLAVEVTDWTAKAVAQAILNSGKSQLRISEETGVPRPTLRRKLKAATAFNWAELILLAEATGVHPSTFTPESFRKPKPTA